MGGFVHLVVFGVVVWWQCFAAGQKGYTICDVPGCNCTLQVQPWKNVNCHLDNDQNVQLPEDSITGDILEINIQGGKFIYFQAKTVNSIVALALLHINGTQKVVLDSKSFHNLSTSSLLIQVRNCDQLLIKTGAFDDMIGFVSAEINNTAYTLIETAAFSKLNGAVFEGIQQLVLTERAFEFKGNGNSQRHGPFTELIFDNVIIPKIPPESFYSSLAKIHFRNSVIDLIESKAFHANDISEVKFVNTSLGRLMKGSFQDKTLVTTFQISKCNVTKLESEAIMAAISTLTIQHSTLSVIKPRAIMGTVARAEILDNYIQTFESHSLIFNNWNKINIEDNIINDLKKSFIDPPLNQKLDIDIQFTFRSNEIHNMEPGALDFVTELEVADILDFDDNLFNYTCRCSLVHWLEEMTNKSKNVGHLLNTSYCSVNELLAKCFNISEDAMNMKAYLQKVCETKKKCERFQGETKNFNSTSKTWTQNHNFARQHWWILFGIVGGMIFLFSVITVIFLAVRGSRWLKRKGYFRNIQYNHNETSNEDENTIVTIDENDRLEMPEELTLEFLQLLWRKLEDPTTQQEATEMIERLYETFIIDENYGNNNRQEEEAHLYEELGNLNLQIPPPPYEEEERPANLLGLPHGPRSILKLMEEKMTPAAPQNEDFHSTPETKPVLNGEYSEPSDAAIHLYSELKSKQNEKQDSLKSTSSNTRMALRPLPNKPFTFESSPSTSTHK